MENQTSISEFFLRGISGSPEQQQLFFGIFLCMYLVTLTGNVLIILAIGSDPHLHTPMYFFLANLSFVDMCLTSSTVTKMLVNVQTQLRTISYVGCLTQMYFFLMFGDLDSFFLAVMAYDRYVAICRPLHYPTLLTNGVISRICVAIAFRCLGLHLPLPFLLAHMPYCRPQVLTHSYCLHPDVARLACPGVGGAVYSLFVVLSAMGLDPLLIFFSYGIIGRVLQGLGSREDRWKAGQTCAAHLSAVLLFYVPMVLLALIDRLRMPIPQHAHTLLSYVHFLLPPLVNPILYSVKMKEIRERIHKRLQPRKVGCAP